MQLIKDIDLDLFLGTKDYMSMKQFDTGRGILITLLENGEVKNLTGHTAKLYFVKADGTEGYISYIPTSDLANGKLLFLFTNNSLAAIGEMKCELNIYKDADLVSSKIFFIEVEKTLRNDLTMESTNEFTALQEALSDCQTLRNELYTATGKLELSFATELNGKLDKTGGTLAGTLVGTDITADNLTATSIKKATKEVATEEYVTTKETALKDTIHTLNTTLQAMSLELSKVGGTTTLTGYDASQVIKAYYKGNGNYDICIHYGFNKKVTDADFSLTMEIPAAITYIETTTAQIANNDNGVSTGLFACMDIGSIKKDSSTGRYQAVIYFKNTKAVSGVVYATLRFIGKL